MSILALMISAVATKLRKVEPQPVDIEVSALQAKIDDLQRQVANLEQNLRIMQLDRTLVHRISEDMRQLAQAQMQSTRAQAQQQGMMQQAMGQNYARAQNGLMLGQEVLGVNQLINEYVCNCVPARHDLFRRG